ncbi:MAG: sigma-70 family RNA polymerase sigma factor [Thermoguttaceae bacterium]
MTAPVGGEQVFFDLSATTGLLTRGPIDVGLSEIDRNLLERCLERKPRAWEDFVDRFLGLVHHVIRHTAQARSVRLGPEDRDDLCAEVFLATIKNDFAVLRNFRGQSSLATYLSVVARRVVVQQMLAHKSIARLQEGAASHPAQEIPDPHAGVERQVSGAEEVQQMLAGLADTEAEVVRMYHLQGKTYQEISMAVGMSENSIGPILSRARDKLRRAGVDPAIS